MTIKNKILFLNTAISQKSVDEEGSVFVEGYASTNDIDRTRDVVPTSVWEAGLENYLKNPVVLAYHDHKKPCGRVVDHKIDEKGLWVKARISSAAEDIYKLVKDEVITAFSIGFKILDAEYNSAAEVFLVKELELLEISVVPVPMNQNTVFSLAKAFDTAKDYVDFKKLFATDGDSAKGLEAAVDANTSDKKEWKMTPEEIAKLVEEAAKKAAYEATVAAAEKAAAEKAAAEKAAAEKAAQEAAIKQAIEAQIKLGQSGAEKLLADATKAIEENSQKALDELKAALAEKTAELEKIAQSKMVHGDKSLKGDVDMADKEKAVLMSKILGRPIENLKMFKKLAEKAGAHLPAGAAGDKWELEVSRNMESEVRRRLVVAPLFRAIAMETNVMTFPLNPEAGLATWVTNAQFGTTASPGAAQTHALKEVTLNAYKVATMEYLNFEEEEDSLLVIMPIVRDAMVRRVSRAVDRAYLMGAGNGADPVRGVALYDATSVVTPTNTGVASVANLRALRKDTGAWGLDPAEITYVVSTEVYYDLLDDTNFQTMDKVGPNATFLTGQVGMVGNSPVLVSAEFPAKAGGAATATTNIGAICVAPGNFLAGNQRGLRFDTQDLVETQRKVLVASLRTGITQVTTNNGAGISVLRWS